MTHDELMAELKVRCEMATSDEERASIAAEIELRERGYAVIPHANISDYGVTSVPLATPLGFTVTGYPTVVDNTPYRVMGGTPAKVMATFKDGVWSINPDVLPPEWRDLPALVADLRARIEVLEKEKRHD